MHSSLVGFLNAVRAASLNLGFTNSAMTPPVADSWRSYVDSLMTSWLMFPGKGEKPDASFTSPETVETDRALCLVGILCTVLLQ